ncbi:sensor histidine kinase [Kytococcus sp. Marseille-QA3725]
MSPNRFRGVGGRASSRTGGIPTHRLDAAVTGPMRVSGQLSRDRAHVGRTRWRHSIRTRIVLAVLLVSMLTSAGLGILLSVQAAEAARENLRQQAVTRLDTVTDSYRLDGRVRRGATADPDAPPTIVTSGMKQGERRSYYDGDTMWATERLGEDVLLTVQLDDDALREQVAERMRTLMLSLALASLLSAAGAWALGSALSSRLRRAATAATAMAEGDTTARTDQGGRDEVAALTRAVDTLAVTLQTRLEAERAFTADVAHELRTPVTGLVSAVELLPEGRPAGLVRTQVGRLRRLVEDLLEVSRLESGSEVASLEEHDLGEIVDRTVRFLAVSAPCERVELRGESPVRVMIDPRRFERIMANLLVNVQRHGGGRCVITVVRRAVVVDDFGEGYPTEILERGPQRFHGSGATKGTGLGLTIISKQAATMGATVEFDRARSGGARTVLRFQAVD